MRLVDSSLLDRNNTGFSASEIAQIYNGLDCCLTIENFEEIIRTYEGTRAIWEPIYEFEKALQASYLDMMARGFAVDHIARWEATEVLRAEIGELKELVRRIVEGGFGLKEFNPGSTKQLKVLFYDLMHIPEIWASHKGERHVAVNRDALEKIAEHHVYATPIVNMILRLRDLAKQEEVFTCDLDRDGRFRAGYSIAGTETGRPSSSENAFGNGRNAQNIDPGLRHVFVADRGFRIGQVDLEQVEARDVGFICGCLFNDWSYLDACESGDLHTNNAKRIWPELGWTGDRARDRAIAGRNFYREFSYRDMAKRGSHLSNYMGTAWTAARVLKVPLQVMEGFQARYCRGGAQDDITPAYPVIPRWWAWSATQLQLKGNLTTLFGRRRYFLGRPNDPATIREAIAFQPQGTTADRMNLGMWRVWKKEPRVGLLAQGFDSITFQYSEEENENDVIESVLELIKVRLRAPNGRSYIVPGEAKVGWNWGAEHTEEMNQKRIAEGKSPLPLNLDGLRKWNREKKDERRRQRWPE